MRRSNPARFSRLGAVGLISLGLASAEAGADDKDWMHDVTVLTVARNGAWGTATREHSSAAIAAAIADCRQRAAGSGSNGSDCGARQVYTRKGWSLAYSCGERTFAVSGRTIVEAHVAAVAQEIDWREVSRLDAPACRLLVAIGPDGRPEDPGLAIDLLPVVSKPSPAR